MNNLRRSCLLLNLQIGNVTRQVQSNAQLIEQCNVIKNRNPRNLEMMRIARKPIGYGLNEPGHNYWNKLIITVSDKYVYAEIHHFKNGPTITVSTKEWALKKQLYRTLDTAAFANVGKVLAQRCLESGISSIFCDIDPTGSQRYTALLDELKKNGLTLKEPRVYVHQRPSSSKRQLKPWTVVE